MNSSGSRRPFKRQRVEAYPKGSILKVVMHNFMTYKHAVVEPGPKLNLVLGPNGTGKSSLVCAISIGLGGRPNLLGRAEEVKDYVRRGEREGWVELTLCSGNPMRPHVIRRDISTAGNSSVWRLDGREVRLKDVEELVRDKLKVQLDNLCQFLPQDKVVEFARMKPVDLLEATEKAIGNGELYDQHKQLIDARKELSDQDASKDALEASLGGLRVENERNTRDVQNIQRREAMLQEVEVARKKVPWQEYEEKRASWAEDKKRREEAKGQLEVLKHTAEEDEGPLVQRQKLLEKMRREKQRLDGELREVELRMVGRAAGGRGGQAAEAGLDDQMSAALDDVRAHKEELLGLEAQAAAREKRMADLAAVIAELEAQVAELPPPGDTGEFGAQRQQLLREQQDVRAQANSLDGQLEDLRSSQEALGRQMAMAAERLRRMDDSKMQRLRVLEQRYRGISNAWHWLQANKARFRGAVYGPIAVEVECPDKFHVQCLEGQVSGAAWSFFVTQYKEDHDLLIQELGQHCNFRPAVSNYTGDPNGPIPHPRGEAIEYARYGIHHTLDSVFTAPAVVKRVLCDESRIHEAYVGGQGARVETLFKEHPRVGMVWTPDASYRCNRSNYNAAAVSTLVADLRPARLLSGATGADDGQEREQSNADIQRCDEELRGIEAKLVDLRGAKEAKEGQVKNIQLKVRKVDQQIQGMHNRHRDLRTSLKSKQLELVRAQKAADPRKRGPKLQRELAAAKKRAFDAVLELAELQAAQGERMLRHAELDLGMRELAMQCERIKEASKRRQAELARIKGIVEQLTVLCNRSKEDVTRAKEDAASVAPLVGEEGERLKEKFAALPDRLADLFAYIEEKQAEADGMLIANPAALRQYNDRCRQIHDQEVQLAAVEDKRQLARATIDDVAGRWLPELQRIVERVNQTFSANFQSVGCAGDVALHEAPGEDFEKYAIEIRVKFRDAEELQTLDANRQSGGERSVSTILYLIALQGVTITPFRVVDEINQGMDPINERKVFMQLVEAACREGTPQCFLLTPKLLPDLPFTRDVTVLQIMNGPHIREVASTFSMDELLGSRRMATPAAA